jgi:hypothetical protein
MRSIHSAPVAMLAGGLLLFAGNAAAQYAPSGVQTDVPEATVTSGGWSTCYQAAFSESGTPLATIQANCDKAQLMMACREIGSPNFKLLAAAPRADVFTDTGTGDTPHDANGVGWYYNDSYSWGFAPAGEPINRSTCDYDEGSQTQPDMRMCIHTNSGSTSDGYRCGSNDLNGNSTWDRVILESDGAAPGVRLDNAGDNVPVLVAEELEIPPTRTLANVGNRLDLIASVDYAFSPGEVRYARISCPGIVFGAGTSVTTSAEASNQIGSVNGLGGSAIFFSITAGSTPVVRGDILTVAGDRGLGAKQSVDCTYGLYDTPSEAQAGGANGRVVSASGAYLRFGPSYALSVNSVGTAIADVESGEVAYGGFTGSAPTYDPGRGQLGAFSYGTTASVEGTTQPITLDGSAVTLGELMGAGTSLVFSGDFSAASDVYLSTASNCGSVNLSADAFDDDSAVFTIGSASELNRYLCYAAGGDPIPAGSFTVALQPVSASASTYTVGDLGPYELGSIERNGTQLQAPLANVPAGWISRMVLTNTGGRDRPYQISVLGETGNTIGTANLSGTVPANGTKVVDLDTVMTSFTGKARGTVVVTVAAPNNQIQGLLQVVSDAGAISNETMVRPSSN